MPIPDFQTLMLPILQVLGDGKTYSMNELERVLAGQFQLSATELQELLPSKTQPVFKNRVAWAKTHLKAAKLIEQPGKGLSEITERGKTLLQQNPSFIGIKVLAQYPEYQEFKNGTSISPTKKNSAVEQTRTPDEIFSTAYEEIQQSLRQELLSVVKSASAQFFENLVVKLLLKMGYGGALEDAGQVTKYSGDGGIDGIIKEDKLGLDFIYIQAKKWEGVVGSPEIQKFAGALLGKQANKGVFITTSGFSTEARNYVKSINSKIVLIDGDQLARLMIEYNVGVYTKDTYEIKKIDMDFFNEE